MLADYYSARPEYASTSTVGHLVYISLRNVVVPEGGDVTGVVD